MLYQGCTATLAFFFVRFFVASKLSAFESLLLLQEDGLDECKARLFIAICWKLMWHLPLKIGLVFCYTST